MIEAKLHELIHQMDRMKVEAEEAASVRWIQQVLECHKLQVHELVRCTTGARDVAAAAAADVCGQLVAILHSRIAH